MTREEAIRRINELADSLEGDLEFCQTRDQHLRGARHVAAARQLSSELSSQTNTVSFTNEGLSV